jgi:hypothetical protein
MRTLRGDVVENGNRATAWRGRAKNKLWRISGALLNFQPSNFRRKFQSQGPQLTSIFTHEFPLTLNQRVVGSSPTGGISKPKIVAASPLT